MTDKGQQKSTKNQTARRPKSAPSRRIIQRGLIAQISTALFQPITFFETLAPMRQTRQWLWIGFIILALIGVSAVQQASSQATPDTETPISPVGDPFSGGELGGDLGGDFGGGLDFGTPPIDTATDTPTDPAQTVNNWTVALIEATRLIIIWGALSIMLIVVPMFKGKPPQIGENIQVAIYASLPLGVMSALQLIFMAAGGQIGAAGLSGLIDEMPMYQTADPFLRSLILSGASQTTLFMVWSLLMVYFGGRFLLRGHRITVLFVIIAWAALLVISPVVTGAIQAEPADVTDAPTDEFTPDMGDFSEMPPPSDIEGIMNPFDEVPTDEMMFDITPEAEMTFEAEMMPEIEMTLEAESTPEIEMTPEGTMP